MKIEWNKVTWYSKTIALVLFVALPFIGFYYGAQYGQALQAVRGSSQSVSTSTSSGSQASGYFSNTSEWQTDSNNQTFSIAYPLGFTVEDNYNSTASTDWRLNAGNTNGVKAVTITVPSLFEPQTNLADSMLTVGYSANASAVSQCLVADPSGGPSEATSTAVINGISFTVFQSSDAGAGNYYQTTSYRTVHNGACYAIEYTIHSGQIANYPASYNLQPFDQAKIISLFKTIVGTFKFSQ
jgi:hypothetical protein